jgi:hypothetical protein
MARARARGRAVVQNALLAGAARCEVGIWRKRKDSVMSTKKTAADDKTVAVNDPDDLKGTLKLFGGSQSDHWNNFLANQTVQTLWTKHSDQETRTDTTVQPLPR